MKRISKRLPVERILTEFQKVENSTARRKGTFKIDVPFEEALKVVAHAKSDPRKQTQRKR